MTRIAINVVFKIKPGAWAEFNAHIRDHATKTLAEEPGCERFDVLQPLNQDGTADQTQIILVEVYQDMAAFTAHRANPRMPGVGQKSQNLIAERTLTICELQP